MGAQPARARPRPPRPRLVYDVCVCVCVSGAVVRGASTSMGDGGLPVLGVRFGGLKSVRFGLRCCCCGCRVPLRPSWPRGPYGLVQCLSHITYCCYTHSRGSLRSPLSDMHIWRPPHFVFAAAANQLRSASIAHFGEPSLYFVFHVEQHADQA
jgi:hypothetical protein